MSWEAFRLTSKSPSELYDVLGPAGVDHLIQQALAAVWNALPAGERSMTAWRKMAGELFDRNMRVWAKIKKPNPAAFFENLRTDPADGHLRQAMVMSWMMLPRAGGRNFSDTKKIVTQIFDRNLAAWEQDNRVFTIAPKKPKTKPVKTTKKSSKKSAKKKSR